MTSQYKSTIETAPIYRFFTVFRWFAKILSFAQFLVIANFSKALRSVH